MDGPFEGKVIGCDASLTIDDDAVHISLTMPWSMIQTGRMVGRSVVLRSGTNMIWFESAGPDEVMAALEGKVETGPAETKASAGGATKRRWGRRRS